MDARARNRYTAWGLTWLAYATYYTGRKGFSVTKKTLSDELGIGTATLGMIDTLYLSAYALGQFISGWTGDRIGARRLIGYGMLISAGACAGFGSFTHAGMFMLLFTVNGFAQSTGWPGTTRAVAEWTTRRNRGSVMALWATCYQVGGIAASIWAGWLLGRYGWRAAFYAPSLWIAIVGILILLLLKPGTDQLESEQGASASAQPSGPDAHAIRRAQRDVIKNPRLIFYGVSYFFIKFIRYTLLFWLPFYLSKELGYAGDQAAYVSTAFEVGGIGGVILIGISSDRLRRFSRSALAAASLLLLALSLFLYGRMGSDSVTVNVVLLACVGAALFGPDSLISGAAAQDAGGAHGAATATGFVNGVGSIGAILEGLVVPVISDQLGWQALFPALVVLAILSALALAPTLKPE